MSAMKLLESKVTIDAVLYTESKRRLCCYCLNKQHLTVSGKTWANVQTPILLMS